uniref:Ovule protein n=1 Tax=Heterorhabditis bacteriophora TaxID=37862 RepID=A0A1I7W6K8_HETBA
MMAEEYSGYCLSIFFAFIRDANRTTYKDVFGFFLSHSLFYFIICFWGSLLMNATVGSPGYHDESGGRPFSPRPSCVILYIVLEQCIYILTNTAAYSRQKKKLLYQYIFIETFGSVMRKHAKSSEQSYKFTIRHMAAQSD